MGSLFSKIFKRESEKDIDKEKNGSAVLIDKKKGGDSPVYSLTLEKIPHGKIEPVSLPSAMLIQVKAKSSSIVFDLSIDREFLIGKSDENDLYLKGEGISDTHAKIRPEEDGYILYDLGSESGVRVNWEKILRHKLEHRDRIKIGSHVLIFELEKKEEKNIFGGVERRKTVRVKPGVTLKFLVHSDNKLKEFTAKVTDVSLDGARIETYKELQKGWIIEAGLFSEELSLIEVMAQVIWVGTKQENDKILYEAGLQFLEIDEGARERLKKYLVKCMSC